MENRRIVISAFGGPDVLTLESGPVPEPGDGEVRVRVLVTSAAFTDVMIRKGQYPGIGERPPFAPGYDMVGVVDALGPGATRFRAGDVVADLTTIGAYADYLCRPEALLTAVPDGLHPVDAAAVILSGVTAWQMLNRVVRVSAGQTVLVHGAGGAVGTMLLQLARREGIAAYGADFAGKHSLIRDLGGLPIDAGARDPEAAMMAAAGERVDAVFDPLGGQSLSRSLHVLKPGGMLVAFGFHDHVLGGGGSIPWDFVRLKLWDWLPNGHATAFYSIGAVRRQHPDWFQEDLAALFELLLDGAIRPVIAEVMPLEEARRAHERIEAGDVEGKIVLQVAPDLPPR